MLVTLVFTQLAPVGLEIAEVRVLDVIVGAAVGVTAGLLAWPRGGSGELRRSSAGLLLRSGDVVRETARALVTTGPRPAETGPPAAIARVPEAMELVEAAYGAYQAERRRDARANWPAVVTAGDHVTRGAEILLDTADPASLAPWRTVVIDWADRVGDAYETVATAVRDGHDPPPQSTVVGPPPDVLLVDVQAWLAGVTKELALVTSRPSAAGGEASRDCSYGRGRPVARSRVGRWAGRVAHRRTARVRAASLPRMLSAGHAPVSSRSDARRPRSTSDELEAERAPIMAVKTESPVDLAKIRPFTIDIPETELVALRERVGTTRWPEMETVADPSQGVQLETMEALARYWGSDYDWRRCEAKLNALPQFMTEIDGLDIHFIHVRSKHEDALPLVITHGWPGSIIEMLNVVGPLTDPTAHGGSADDAFHVVIPSLPGFGFSGKPSAPGWGPEHIAQAWVELMKRLGYTQFAAQGGDWGAIITDAMGAQAPQELLGIHTNMPGTVPPNVFKALTSNVLGTGDPRPSGLSTEENQAFDQLAFLYTKGIGYAVEMALHPQTLYGLADSPIALAAWMIDHDRRSYEDISQAFVDGSPIGNLTRDEVLDNITLTWLTNTGISSARIYWENKRGFFDAKGVSIPAAVSVFPHELYQAPRSWTEQAYPNLIYFNEVDKGNHFAAWQEPELFVTEVRNGLRTLR